MSIRSTRAVVVNGPQEFGLQEVGLRELGPEEVRVRTRYTSISAGTERMLMAGQLVEMAGLPFPCIPGYETVGRVVEVGAAVPNSQQWQDQWVFVGGSHGYEGVTSAWGGQSEYVTTSYQKALRLPAGLDPAQAVAIAPAATAWHGIQLLTLQPAQAVAIAPAATAWHGIQLLTLQPGQRVLVLGQGPIGQLAAQAASLTGATVAVADIAPARLEAARTNGPKIDLSRQTLKDALDGPLDVLIDATGKMEALASHLMSVRSRGRVLLLGFYQKIELPFAIPFIKELSFQPSREWADEDIQAVGVALAGGQLEVSHLFTDRFQIEQIKEAYAAAFDQQNHLKVLIEWPE